MRAFAAAALACTLACGAADAGYKSPTSDDGELIAYLKHEGSDLSKPHMVEFFLTLPDQETAQRVLPQVEALGFKSDSGRTAHTREWYIRGKRAIVPTIAELRKWRRVFTEIAVANGGQYSGPLALPPD